MKCIPWRHQPRLFPDLSVHCPSGTLCGGKFPLHIPPARRVYNANRQQYGSRVQRVRQLHPEPMGVSVSVSGIPEQVTKNCSKHGPNNICFPMARKEVYSMYVEVPISSASTPFPHNKHPPISVTLRYRATPPFDVSNGRYDVALWATIADFPYSWPLWQRYSSKFVATQLVRQRTVFFAVLQTIA